MLLNPFVSTILFQCSCTREEVCWLYIIVGGVRLKENTYLQSVVEFWPGLLPVCFSAKLSDIQGGNIKYVCHFLKYPV